MKAEKQYPNVLPFRRSQAEYWNNTSYDQIVLDLLDAIDRKRGNIKYLRLNEAGDFKDQKDVDKLKTIAGLLQALKPDLVIYTYTHRKDLYFKELPKNVVINGSGFMVHNNFKAVVDLPAKKPACPGDCKACNLCKKRSRKTIYIKYH